MDSMYEYKMNYNTNTDKIEFTKTEAATPKVNHLWKYNEDKILKEVEEYVISTYGSHYCGHNEEYKDIQTIDLMASKDLARDFCQANMSSS